MVVKIIKYGKLPEDKEYIQTCNNCGTEFSFLKKDAKLIEDFREGSFLSINCPLCRTSCTTHK